MNFPADLSTALSRRALLQKSTTGIGTLALASILSPGAFGASGPEVPGALKQLHFAPKARRIIYLFMSGAPSHLEVFDATRKLTEMQGQELPDSVRKGQRITTMTSGQKNLFFVGSPFTFAKYG